MMDALTYYVEQLREALTLATARGDKAERIEDAARSLLIAWDAEQEVFDNVEMFEVVAEGEVTVDLANGVIVRVTEVQS